MPQSLFDTKETWQKEPLHAFEAFVATTRFQRLGRKKHSEQPLRRSSQMVYRAMFGNFIRWMTDVKGGANLFQITGPELLEFLEKSDKAGQGETAALASGIRKRYLELFKRVYAHLEVFPNPAEQALLSIVETGSAARLGKDAPMASLTDRQVIAFMRALPEPKNWKSTRDRAMLAMTIGSGLKTSEVIGMHTENIGEHDGSGGMIIHVSPSSTGGSSTLHRSHLRAFAVEDVERWICMREVLQIPGRILFPASLQGGTLHPATFYRHVKSTLERAGITVPRKGGRTLRNTYAIRELQTGQPPEHVAELLGHRTERSTEPYIDRAKLRQGSLPFKGKSLAKASGSGNE